MIITRTPLRVSFFGGGSDFKNFYKENKAAVLTTSINKYIYVFVKKKFDESVRFSYKVTENVKSAVELKHKLAREALNYFQINSGIEIATIADIPSEGSGLGSSSTFTVGLVKGLSKLKGIELNTSEIASIACNLEIEKCSEPIGKQDQYAAATGGFNFIEFNSDETVVIEKINLNKEKLANFTDNLLMFYTGINRKASSILAEQNEDIKNLDKRNLLIEMVDLAYEVKNKILQNNFDDFGKYLDVAWSLKKGLNKNISNADIDKIYYDGLSSGADGGKILGAGAGGFILFYVKPEFHESVKRKLGYLKFFDFKLDFDGLQFINF